MKNMAFLQFITDEQLLRKIYEHFLSNLQAEYDQKYDRVIEEFESRLDELSDGVPYGTHCNN